MCVCLVFALSRQPVTYSSVCSLAYHSNECLLNRHMWRCVLERRKKKVTHTSRFTLQFFFYPPCVCCAGAQVWRCGATLQKRPLGRSAVQSECPLASTLQTLAITPLLSPPPPPLRTHWPEAPGISLSAQHVSVLPFSLPAAVR